MKKYEENRIKAEAIANICRLIESLIEDAQSYQEHYKTKLTEETECEYYKEQIEVYKVKETVYNAIMKELCK